MKHYFNILFFVLLFLIFILLKVDFYFYIFGFLLFSSLTFLGVTNIGFNYFIKSFNKNSETKEKILSITFDDGPTEFTPKFLDLLKKHNAKATFFCIGKQIEKHPKILKKIIEDGHEIGNHTFSHPNKMGFLSTKNIILEISKNDEIIRKIGNISTKLYRPPFGITNPKISKAIRMTNKKSIGWNIRSFDTTTKNEEKILQRILPNIKPGSVILLHDTSEKTYHVLEHLLLFLHRENYETFTITELFNFKK